MEGQDQLHGQDAHQHPPLQQQQQQQQPLPNPSLQTPIAPLQSSDGQFSCQWVGCHERAANAEQLYVCRSDPTVRQQAPTDKHQ